MPAIAWWAGGLACIAGAVLVSPTSAAAAIALVVCGVGLVGVYWVREHPGGPHERLDWGDGANDGYLGDGGASGSDGGGGDGGGGGGGGGS
jgi:hypothetical protein